MGLILFENGSYSVPFKIQKDLKATSPPSHPPISLKTSNQNSEIAILFILVEGSGNYVFEEDTPAPTALRAMVVSYAQGGV
jgi:hypothetical protein